MIRNEAANDTNNYDNNAAYITLRICLHKHMRWMLRQFLNNSEQIACECGQRGAGKERAHVVRTLQLVLVKFAE